MINLSVRSRKETIAAIDTIAKLKGLNRTQVLRKILEEGVEREKVLTAIELYQKGASLERASNDANASLWDVIDALSRLGISMRFEIDQEKLLFARAFEKINPRLAKKILES